MRSEIETLLMQSGVSGEEGPVLNWIRKQLPELVSARQDAMGNLIVHRPGRGKNLLAVTPVDTAGLIVTHFDGEKARVGMMGPLAPWMYAGRIVCLSGGGQALVLADKTDGAPEADSLWLKGLDGAALTVGQTAVLRPEVQEGNDWIGAENLSTRIGPWLLLEFLRNCQKDWDLFCVFAAQGQLGGRGAETAAFSMQPEEVLLLGTCPASPETAAGQGPVVPAMDKTAVYAPSLRARLERAAAAEKIPVQKAVLLKQARGGGGLCKAAAGVPVGCLLVPVEQGGAMELAQKSDLLACRDVLLALEEQ